MTMGGWASNEFCYTVEGGAGQSYLGEVPHV